MLSGNNTLISCQYFGIYMQPIQCKTYFENIINALPYCIFTKDIDLNYTACNLRFVQNTGFCDASEILGQSDFEMPWTKEQALLYRADDLLIIKNREPKLNYLEFQQAKTGEERINLVSKWPIISADNQVIGLICIYNNMMDSHILLTNSEAHKNRTFSIAINDGIIRFSPKETKILYYLIRGKSARDISEKLNISNRTVEGYIENIKNKMMVSKKSEIIEKIIDIILDVSKL